MVRTLLVAICLCLLPTLAFAQSGGVGGDWYRGGGIALIHCTSCHVIDNKGTGARFSDPPSFPKIAFHPKKSKPAYIRRQLSTSHPRMPKIKLSERDTNDLIAYIRSWRYRVLKY